MAFKKLKVCSGSSGVAHRKLQTGGGAEIDGILQQNRLHIDARRIEPQREIFRVSLSGKDLHARERLRNVAARAYGEVAGPSLAL